MTEELQKVLGAGAEATIAVDDDGLLAIAIITEATGRAEAGAPIARAPIVPVPTKLYRPRVTSDYVQRPELAKRLSRALNRPLILVSAPPGYGKTSLVSSWLEECACSSSWISLDEADNDLDLILFTFIVALEQMLPDAFPTTRDLLRRTPTPRLTTLSASIVKELDAATHSAAKGTEHLLVLDDYHNIRNTDVHQLLVDLLRHPLPRFHLAIVTRRDPPIGLSSLRARGQIAEFRVEDLRFGLTDAAVLMDRLLQEPLDQKALMKLGDRTEGWVTGLRLAALAARNTQALSRALEEPDSESRYTMDYLVDEVLRRQPADIQRFLL